MTTTYRTAVIDGVSVPTTTEGALAVEKLQSQLRDARAEIDGLQGQLDALNSCRNAGPATPADARKAAADAHAAMTRRISDSWKGTGRDA